MLTEKKIIRYRTAMLAYRDISYEVNFELMTFYALNHREGKLYEYTLVIPLTCSTFKVDSSSTTPWLQSKVANMYVHCISHSSTGLDWTICLLRAKYIHSVILFNYWTNSQTNYAALQHTAGLPSTPFIFTKLTVVQFILINYSYHYMYLGIQ